MGTPALVGFGDTDSFNANAEAIRRPWLHAALGEKDATFGWPRKACDERDTRKASPSRS